LESASILWQVVELQLGTVATFCEQLYRIYFEVFLDWTVMGGRK